jgi:DNA-binding NtrC family response regulator
VTVAGVAEGHPPPRAPPPIAAGEAETHPAEGRWPAPRFGPLIGHGERMRALFARLARVAQSNAPVLIEGETGTGKELVARAIHDASPRARAPFAVIDCGALPEHLLEGELFGHARGAFTGAVEPRPGAIEAAEGGTVFLDEIGELPLSMQPKLLRLLESRTVRRLGETRHRPVDVRFLSATHQSLEAMVMAGAFRQDLYFRLAVLPARIPPLRERRDDLPGLLAHFLSDGGGALPAPDELLRGLERRRWRGNVRELRSFAERVLTLGAREALASLATDDIAPEAQAADEAPVHLSEELLRLPYRRMRELCLDAVEREYVRTVLARHDQNVSATAAAAGLNRTYLHRLIRRHGLALPAPRGR